jgi:hypothetical protein
LIERLIGKNAGAIDEDVAWLGDARLSIPENRLDRGYNFRGGGRDEFPLGFMVGDRNVANSDPARSRA